MKRTANSPSRARGRRTVSRSVFVRLFALLLCALSLVAQTRAASANEWVRASSSSVIRERAPRIESNALSVHASPSVARAPFLSRLSIARASRVPARFASARPLVANARAGVRASQVTHFHAKRRIPRMNSEEPPRA